MGGRPLTVMNVACFDPCAAPAEVWANILRGMHDKTVEAGAVVVGGHSVEDKQPKFGMSVTGIINPLHVFANTSAEPGDKIYLSKPLGTGIISTAGKFEEASAEELAAAILAMSTLNRDACEIGLTAGVRCATDITGFGLAGHLFNIARASSVSIVLDSASFPLLPGVERQLELGNKTGGATNNRAYMGDSLIFAESVSEWVSDVVLDPQTSGGLALFSAKALALPCIGEVQAGPAQIHVR